MHPQHAKEILEEIMRFFEHGQSVSPDALLFPDDLPLKDHIEFALGGVSSKACRDTSDLMAAPFRVGLPHC